MFGLSSPIYVGATIRYLFHHITFGKYLKGLHRPDLCIGLVYNDAIGIRKVSFVPDEYYHIYNRGNSKQKIFPPPKDFGRFVKILYLANSEKGFKFRDTTGQIYDIERGKQLVSIGAYCLMPNNFHILMKEVDEGGLSKFMQKLTTAYSMYYNTKYKRSGSLFEGRFKSEHLYDDQYLKYIFSYIHLNPLKLLDNEWKENGIKNKSSALRFLDQYNFSTYPEYKGINRPEKVILDRKPFPDYFPTQQSFSKEIFEWITFKT